MFSCDVIIWDDNTPLFYFSWKLHSLKYLCISSYIRKPFLIYMTLHSIPSEFPYMWGKFCFSFLWVQLKQGSLLFGHFPCFLEACYIRVACGRRWRAWRPSPTPASCPSVTSATAPAPAPATAPGTDWPEISTPAAGPMTPLRPTGENNCLHCLFVCLLWPRGCLRKTKNRILWSSPIDDHVHTRYLTLTVFCLA